VSPTNIDIRSRSGLGDVTLHWIESTDNGPVSGIVRAQVAKDGGFLDIEASSSRRRAPTTTRSR
jgi:hypothetical protein